MGLHTFIGHYLLFTSKYVYSLQYMWRFERKYFYVDSGKGQLSPSKKHEKRHGYRFRGAFLYLL